MSGIGRAGDSGASGWPAWTSATSLLVNSWANFGAPFATIAYRKSNDGLWLALTGVIGGGADDTVAFTLPAGYRPTTRHDIGAFDTAVPGLLKVVINADGTVLMKASAAACMDMIVPLDI